jgi:hypothetical protein
VRYGWSVVESLVGWVGSIIMDGSLADSRSRVTVKRVALISLLENNLATKISLSREIR